MKIALCLSGHMRNYKRLAENFYNFRNYLSQYGQVDVFVTTWNRRNTSNSWSVQHGLNESNSHNDIIIYDDIKNHYNTDFIQILDYDFYDSNFSPLRYNNFTNKEYNWKPHPSVGSGCFGIHNGIVHSTKMFYLIFMANILKSQQEFLNNQHYDFVMRLRPDMLFIENEYTKSLQMNFLDINKLYLPVGHIWTDQFACGSSHIMNKYASSILRIASVNDNDIFGEPEVVMNECLLNLIGSENIVRIPKVGVILAENPNSPIVHR